MREIKITVSEVVALEIVDAIRYQAIMWHNYYIDVPTVKNWAHRVAINLRDTADQIEQQVVTIHDDTES